MPHLAETEKCYGTTKHDFSMATVCSSMLSFDELFAI